LPSQVTEIKPHARHMRFFVPIWRKCPKSLSLPSYWWWVEGQIHVILQMLMSLTNPTWIPLHHSFHISETTNYSSIIIHMKSEDISFHSQIKPLDPLISNDSNPYFLLPFQLSFVIFTIFLSNNTDRLK
jgi:hypothetical protein